MLQEQLVTSDRAGPRKKWETENNLDIPNLPKYILFLPW